MLRKILHHRKCVVVRKLAKRRVIFVLTIIIVAIVWPLYVFFLKESYIKIENLNFLNVGDFSCPGSIEHSACTVAAGKNDLKSLGMTKCNTLANMCKGFVANEGAKTVTLKDNFYGPGDIAAGMVVFIKKEYTSLLNYSAMFTVCADSLEEDEDNKLDLSYNKRCKLPNLDAFDKRIMGAMLLPPKLTCPGHQHLAYYKNGKLSINVKSKASKAKWSVIKVKPGEGSNFVYSSSGTLTADKSEVSIKEDMVRVDVTTSESDAIQTDFYAEITPKSDVLKRIKKAGIPLNVMIIGFDSTSHSHFQRKLGKVYKYLKDDLKSFIFNGYSIVGDGTTPALLGMLTGKREDELPEGRFRMSGAKCLDDWPWIFKKFKEHGFATMYNEDEVEAGAFTYRLVGFCNAPVDHYLLPYWYAASDANSPFIVLRSNYLSDHCAGSQAIHNISLNVITSMFKAYPQTLKFGLTFFSDISHNKVNSLSLMEDDLYEFLRSLKDQDHLSNTMLILLGDHGIRYGAIRSTVIGKIEERLPFLSITLPGWFAETYPEYAKNLRNNLNVLTSPFDLHATFNHMLTDPLLPAGLNYGKSLFTNVGDRTCLESGILTHFCPCMEWKAVDINHEHIKKSAQEIVRHINDLISKEHLSNKCALLTLYEVKSAAKVMPNEDVQTYEKAADVDGREVFKGTKPKGMCSYQLQVVTLPNHGVFEATVQLTSAKIIVNPQMSRIDRYGSQPKCIMETHHHLREYCYCHQTF